MKDFKNLGPIDYFGILWRRRWYVLAVFILVSSGICLYAWRRPNVYRSEAKILIESAAIPKDYVRPSEVATPEEQIAAVRQQIQSRSFLERMVQEFQLFGYGTNKDFSMDSAVLGVSRSIQILNTSRNTFTVSYTTTDAQFAQTFTRRIVETFIQAANSSRRARAVETDQFLDEQLRQSELDLAAQEEKIKQFKTKHLGELPEQSTANLNSLSGLHSQLVAIENALQQTRDRQKINDIRAQEQSRLSILTKNMAIPASDPQSILAGVPQANSKLEAKKAELAALRARYTSNHPDVLRASRELEDLKKQSLEMMSPITEAESAANEQSQSPDIGKMQDIEVAALKVETESINSEIAKREKEREAILNQIKAYQARLNLAPALEQELMALSREHDALRLQYANLQSKKFQAQMTANLETNKSNDTYKIIDEANLPDKPAFPDSVQLMLMGLCAGIVLGIGTGFGRELLDTTLSSEEEVSAVLKLPVLVTISEIPKKLPRRATESGRLAKSA